jgi:hypothetical protein
MENKDGYFTTNGNNALKQKGIEVEQCTGDKNSPYFPVIKRTINNDTDMDECKNVFKKLKSIGLIRADRFESNKWKIFSTIKDEYIEYNFNLGFKEDITICIKKYIVVKLGIQEASPNTIKRALDAIVDMLRFTNMLKEDKLMEFKQYLVSKKDKNRLFYCTNFLEFSNMENSMEYLKVLNTCNIPNYDQIRKIPGIYSMIRYDKIIMDLIASNDITLKYRYYPILIWWYVTTIIPTRPNEFLMLKRDCLKYEDGQHYLILDRIKDNKKYQPGVYKLKKFCIPEELYDFISNFVNVANEIDDGEFLFTQKYYNKMCLTKPETCEKHNRITIDKMSYLYRMFEKNIVAEMYGYNVVEIGNMKDKNDIEKLKLNDTRHYAFINLIMQNVPSEQTRLLGGHKTENQQLHYFAHFDILFQNRIYQMSKYSKNAGGFFDIKEANQVDWSLKELDKDMMGVDYYFLPKVMGGLGRCDSKDFPASCRCNECLFCEHFIPDHNVSKEYLEQIKEDNMENIEINRKVLAKLTIDNPNVITASQSGSLSSTIAAYIKQDLLLEIYSYTK